MSIGNDGPWRFQDKGAQQSADSAAYNNGRPPSNESIAQWRHRKQIERDDARSEWQRLEDELNLPDEIVRTMLS